MRKRSISCAVGRAAGGAEAGGTVAWIDVPAGQLGLAAGMAHIADERQLTGAEAFHIGSVTKMVTATVALQLVEEGMLALEEPIAEVIPEQAARFEHGDQITLRQLLGHTSGLPDFLDREFDRQLAEASSVEDGVLIRGCSDPDQAELLDYAAGKSARFEPGTRGEYSNTNYVLIGKAIEAVTGQPLEAVYRERVFEPLDMTDTWLTCAEQPRTEIAHGYEPHPERSPFTGIDAEVLDLTDFEKPFVSAAGGLVSTGKDMAVFARALFTGEFFNDDATLQAMREPHPLTSQGGPERPYGLGLEMDGDGIGHSGGLPGYNTQLRYYPDPDIVVVALGNQIAPQGPPPAHAAVSAIRTILVDNDTVTTPADDAAMRSRVIDAALNALNDDYVFPGVARDMAQAIRAHDGRDAYDGLHGAGFARRLTDDLRAVSDDKHLTVLYRPDGPPGPPPGPPGAPPSGPHPPDTPRPPGAPPPAAPPGQLDHGISRVEQLPGNIGVVALAGFVPPNPAARTAIADAMDTIHETDALIIDLRHNHGGSPDMVAHVLSYLLGPDPMPVTSFHDSDGNLINQHSTTAQLQGPRYGHTKDVYVLTSSQTVSGGEHFAYDLKHFDRATIVGETTAGAAHPARPVRLPADFDMALPFAQPINPVTGTNWEGNGVEPDIAVPASDALGTALGQAKS